MSKTADQSAGRFVAVSETMHERVRHQRLGASWPRRDLILLLGITAAAAVLRFWHVELWSVSTAEAETWQSATSGRTGMSAVQLALWFLFEFGFLPGHGEGWLRLPFLFVATLAVPVLALVGDALVGRRAALVAAGLLAVHPWHVEVCQTATGHGAALTFLLLALGSGWVASRTRWVTTWVLAVVMAAVAGACHPIGWLAGLTLVTSWLLLAWQRAERRERITTAIVVTFVWTLAIGATWWLRPAGAGGSPIALLGAAVDWTAAAGLPVLALAALAPWLAAGRPRRRRFVALAAVVPVVFAVLVSAIALPPSRDYVLAALPSVLLLAAIGALSCFDRVRAALGGGRAIAVLVPSGMVALVVLVELGVGTFLYSTARRGSRPDWREARDQVVRRAERPSLRVLVASGQMPLLYYLRPNHWRELPGGGDPHPGLAVSRIDLTAPKLAVWAEAATTERTELYVALLEDELAAVQSDRAARLALQAFELVEVLPCAGTAHDETIYVYRLAGER